jgi:hypothetical protein
MRLPVPTNRLVAFTLAGALMTMVVAGVLAVPGGLAETSDREATPAAADGGQAQFGADAPTPNQNFTPAVQTQSGYGEHEEDEEHEEEEEHEEDEDEYEEEGDEYEDDRKYEDRDEVEEAE